MRGANGRPRARILNYPENILKTFVNRVFVPCFALLPAAAQAATGLIDKMAPEPTGNVIWVGVFLLVFLGVCVWGGVAIYRAQRKSKVVDAGKS